MRFSRMVLVVFLALGTALFGAPFASANATGLTVDVYSFDSASTPERQPYQLCADAWVHVDKIDADYDGEYAGVVAGCQQEFVLVHYTGFLTFPESGTYAFSAPADDGFWMSLDEKPIITNDWVLKGRWGSVYPDIAIEANHPYALDAWYYEYGGGASNTLTYSPDNGLNWATVPAEFFTTDGSAPVFPVKHSLSKPFNLSGAASGTTVDLTWESLAEKTPIEHYTLSWTYAGINGMAINAPSASAKIENLPEDTDVTFWARSDNDTFATYSESSAPIVVRTGFKAVVPPDPDPVVPDPVDPDPVIPDPVIPDPIIPDPVVPVVPDPEPTPEVTPSVTPTVESTESPTSEIKNPVEETNLTTMDPASINPASLSDGQVAFLITYANEVLSNSEQGSPEYEQALEQLMVAAQADDIEIDPALAAIPLIGNVAAGLTDAINYLGNVGADMSPQVRETAKKEVIASVVVTQIAVQASGLAAQTAISGSTTSSPTNRRFKE